MVGTWWVWQKLLLFNDNYKHLSLTGHLRWSSCLGFFVFLVLFFRWSSFSVGADHVEPQADSLSLAPVPWLRGCRLLRAPSTPFSGGLPAPSPESSSAGHHTPSDPCLTQDRYSRVSGENNGFPSQPGPWRWNCKNAFKFQGLFDFLAIAIALLLSKNFVITFQDFRHGSLCIFHSKR